MQCCQDPSSDNPEIVSLGLGSLVFSALDVLTMSMFVQRDTRRSGCG